MSELRTIHAHLGELLKSIVLPENWRELIHRDMMAKAFATTATPETVEREKECLLTRHLIIQLF